RGPATGAHLRAGGFCDCLPAFLSPACEWNVRVGANSPSLCPTMFSVTNTGTNFRPLCTANVRPTASGMIVERRDQVLIGFLSPELVVASIFLSRWPSMNGPFLILRAISALRLAMLDDHRIRALVVPRLLALGEQAPGRGRVTPAVPARAAVVRTAPQPPAPARLAEADVLVLEVGDLTDARAASDVHATHLAARELDQRIIAVLGHELGRGARGSHELPALALLGL